MCACVRAPRTLKSSLNTRTVNEVDEAVVEEVVDEGDSDEAKVDMALISGAVEDGRMVKVF